MYQTAHVKDPAEQARLQPWVQMECYQLSHSRQVSQVECLELGSQKICRERQDASIQKLGIAPADFCTLSISRCGPAVRFSEQQCETGDTVYFMPGNVEFDVYVPAGVETIYVGFNQDEFLQGIRALNPALWEVPPQDVVPLATGCHHTFRETIDHCLTAARDARQRGQMLHMPVLRSLLVESVSLIAAATPRGRMPSYSNRRRALRIGRAARRFAEDQIMADELPTVTDICKELRVSERTLQYSFREYIGLSPIAYLRALRLNRVRAELANADPQSTTVTQVAMRYGFVHLGRFAGDYKRMFGVTPSETFNS
ncbi:hypothetical protein Q669_29190 [Labrenzia sp. C1B10]|jgi:AraC family ethanolamine operon transcriptional activator|uniref:helix-turn-helix domain-containing protein n=1 Tax=unclassified Labrenzia TaxID=2648686 RepID=UPI0003B80BB9|nr:MULTISPECIES: helix-turn-helix domain-containing protein [unclassified Labrenzia]ERP95962.1 hypothetical protein Q669_29190 [Labrenzia sp. C1B10]ERS09548.1 hypothetical protein Q675_00020 [Labrenzia sp. C1B70]